MHSYAKFQLPSYPLITTPRFQILKSRNSALFTESIWKATKPHFPTNLLHINFLLILYFILEENEKLFKASTRQLKNWDWDWFWLESWNLALSLLKPNVSASSSLDPTVGELFIKVFVFCILFFNFYTFCFGNTTNLSLEQCFPTFFCAMPHLSLFKIIMPPM